VKEAHGAPLPADLLADSARTGRRPRRCARAHGAAAMLNTTSKFSLPVGPQPQSPAVDVSDTNDSWSYPDNVAWIAT